MTRIGNNLLADNSDEKIPKFQFEITYWVDYPIFETTAMAVGYDEIELLKAFHSGKEWAFDVIYQQYSRRLIYVVERLVDNKENAEDIVADSFMKLLQKQEVFTSLSGLRAFLFKVAQNASVDWIRAQKRHDASHNELKYLIDEAEHDVERNLIRSQILDILYSEVQKLPTQSREVMTRSFFRGESIAEIAEQLGLAYKTVQNIKTASVRQLRVRILELELSGAIFPLLLWYLQEG